MNNSNVLPKLLYIYPKDVETTGLGRNVPKQKQKKPVW